MEGCASVRPAGTGGLRLNKGNRDPCLYVLRRAAYAVGKVAERAAHLLGLAWREAAYAAVAAGADALEIEVHDCPAKAWSRISRT